MKLGEVAEPALHLDCVAALGEQQRCARVPEAVEANPGQARLLAGGLEHSTKHLSELATVEMDSWLLLLPSANELHPGASRELLPLPLQLGPIRPPNRFPETTKHPDYQASLRCSRWDVNNPRRNRRPGFQ